MNKKLYRSRRNKTISGVCGGIAGYFNIDATIVRLIWVAAFLLSAGFPALLAYIAAVFIIPLEPDSDDNNDNIYYTVHKDEDK